MSRNLATEAKPLSLRSLLGVLRTLRVGRPWLPPTRMVESRCGAVAWGLWPTLRFHIPLIEPDVQISRIRLSDKTSRLCSRV